MSVPPELGELLYQQAESLLTQNDRLVLEQFDQLLVDLKRSAGDIHGEEITAVIEQAFQMVPGARELVARRDKLFELLYVAEEEGKNLPM